MVTIRDLPPPGLDMMAGLGIEDSDWPDKFQKTSRYFPAFDCLIYLKQDCSYRAVRLSPLVTLLLHPKKDEGVGIKIKGARWVAEGVRAIVKGVGGEFSESNVMQVVALMEAALFAAGDQLITTAEDRRRERYVKLARKLAREAGDVPMSELKMAA